MYYDLIKYHDSTDYRLGGKWVLYVYSNVEYTDVGVVVCGLGVSAI